MQLSIIIVSYNTAKLTVQTVKSVYDSIAKKSPLQKNFEIIVVDNDSHDDTIKKLEALKKANLKIIKSRENLGFGRGNNLGFKHATGQYILFLNSDTIVEPEALDKMVDYYADHRQGKKSIGLLAAQLLNPDGTYQPQGGDLPTLFSIFNTMFFLDDIPVLGKLLPAVQHTGGRFDQGEIEEKQFIAKGWVGGTAVMIYREYLEDFGGWDPEIFMYGEDQELAYRLHQLNFRHGILTSAQITHLGSASSSSKNAILGEIKGYFYFFRKYYPQERSVYLKAILYFAMIIRIFVYSFLKKDQQRSEIYSEALGLVEKQEV